MVAKAIKLAENLESAWVSHQTFALLNGLQLKTVQSLLQSQVIPRGGNGYVHLASAQRAYSNHLRASVKGEDANSGSFAVQRTRLTKAKADQAELTRRSMVGDLIKASEVEEAWGAQYSMLRTHMLGIPPKVAARIVMAKNAVEAQSIVAAEVYDALERVVDYKFESKRDGNDDLLAGPIAEDHLSDDDGESEIEAAPAPQRKPVGRPRKAVKRRK